VHRLKNVLIFRRPQAVSKDEGRKVSSREKIKQSFEMRFALLRMRIEVKPVI
jgi:hypothetical protein